MRQIPPLPIPCVAGAIGDPIPATDYLYKTVEITGLSSGSLEIMVRGATTFFSAKHVSANGLYEISATATEMKIDGTNALGAGLTANLLAFDARSDG